ncbi:hypothetical protein T4B_163 [Trichinella pseudospiralis]|uniref:Uncharacterized protein n=1 Tax=Trichinella pseudospiralis TaxID=6337 RepID=A0A0V1IJ83_TRIPS|nr:hypothetical protein T4B_163 [Trichinella pseudospiralis]
MPQAELSSGYVMERVNELESILDEEPLLRVSGRLERVNFRDKACVTQRSPSYKTELKMEGDFTFQVATTLFANHNVELNSMVTTSREEHNNYYRKVVIHIIIIP